MKTTFFLTAQKIQTQDTDPSGVQMIVSDSPTEFRDGYNPRCRQTLYQHNLAFDLFALLKILRHLAKF